MSDFLASLKPGDEVAIDCSKYGTDRYRLGKVERVTPSGQIVLVGGERFDATGHRIGGNDPYHRPTLCATTDKVRDWLKRQELHRLFSVLERCSDLPTATLEAIKAALKAMEGGK